jgi:hypothetical protein
VQSRTTSSAAFSSKMVARVARRSARFADAVQRDLRRLQGIELRLMRGKLSQTRPLKKSCRLSRVGTPPVAPMNSS